MAAPTMSVTFDLRRRPVTPEAPGYGLGLVPRPLRIPLFGVADGQPPAAEQRRGDHRANEKQSARYGEGHRVAVNRGRRLHSRARGTAVHVVGERRGEN